MTTSALIEEARADGLELRINGEKLKLLGPVEVVERWKPRIVASKPEILAALSAPRSTWWLVHYPDREPVEVACFPDVSHDEILERHPDAIAAEPIPLRSNETSRACSTCEHVTRRGGCGEPVKAGLSDLPGVIFYGPDKGATCPAWLASIPDDLMDMIQVQSSRYAFDDDDLRLMHQAARTDRDGLRVLLVAKT